MNVITRYKRRKAHIDYMYGAIHALHRDIFNSALEHCLKKSKHEKQKLAIKIKNYKKYNKRLQLLEY